jgi:DNA-3-methyladenine glycosylase II
METAVQPIGRYSLAASTRFLEGFVPAGYAPPPVPGHLHLAFPLEGHDAVAAVCARQPSDPDGEVLLEAVIDGDGPPSAALDQLTRILSLDADGNGYDEVGGRDPTIGRLQASYPGLRPVLFHSPYEAAAWAIIGARIAIRQAARVKSAMAQSIGTEVTIHGQALHAFPAPGRLATLDDFPGLFGRKAEYLRGIAAAAIDGRLDSTMLRALSEDEALARLERIPGIGPFSAELVLLRAVGVRDRAPVTESRLPRAIKLVYGRPEPTRDELTALTEGWRPFRTWVTLLVRTHLEEETHEIRDGGRRPG